MFTIEIQKQRKQFGSIYPEKQVAIKKKKRGLSIKAELSSAAIYICMYVCVYGCKLPEEKERHRKKKSCNQKIRGLIRR